MIDWLLYRYFKDHRDDKTDYDFETVLPNYTQLTVQADQEHIALEGASDTENLSTLQARSIFRDTIKKVKELQKQAEESIRQNAAGERTHKSDVLKMYQAFKQGSYDGGRQFDCPAVSDRGLRREWLQADQRVNKIYWPEVQLKVGQSTRTIRLATTYREFNNEKEKAKFRKQRGRVLQRKIRDKLEEKGCKVTTRGIFPPGSSDTVDELEVMRGFSIRCDIMNSPVGKGPGESPESLFLGIDLEREVIRKNNMMHEIKNKRRNRECESWDAVHRWLCRADSRGGSPPNGGIMVFNRYTPNNQGLSRGVK